MGKLTGNIRDTIDRSRSVNRAPSGKVYIYIYHSGRFSGDDERNWQRKVVTWISMANNLVLAMDLAVSSEGTREHYCKL